MGLKCRKKYFRIEEEVHYINCAYQAPMMRSLEAVGRTVLRKRTRPYKYTVGDFFDPVEELKHCFAQLIGVPDHERIALLPSVSYGISTVATNLVLQSYENIVIVGGQFPSNVYSWKRLCDKYGAELRVVESPKNRADWSMLIADAINENTRVLAMGHIHWADGTKFRITSITEKARSMGALVIIDGTQSIGALPFPFDEVQPDALICAGYKWLMGPYALGLAYYGPWFDDKLPLEDNWISRKNSDDFQQLVNYEDAYRPKAFRFSVGESSNFLLVPVLCQAIKQINDWRPSRIQKYCKKLTDPFITHWEEMGYEIAPPELRAAHLFGIQIPEGAKASAIQPILKRHNVHVSMRGNSIRISPHVYNDKEDLIALTNVLWEFANIHNSVPELS